MNEERTKRVLDRLEQIRIRDVADGLAEVLGDKAKEFSLNEVAQDLVSRGIEDKESLYHMNPTVLDGILYTAMADENARGLVPCGEDSPFLELVTISAAGNDIVLNYDGFSYPGHEEWVLNRGEGVTVTLVSGGVVRVPPENTLLEMQEAWQNGSHRVESWPYTVRGTVEFTKAIEASNWVQLSPEEIAEALRDPSGHLGSFRCTTDDLGRAGEILRGVVPCR